MYLVCCNSPLYSAGVIIVVLILRLHPPPPLRALQERDCYSTKHLHSVLALDLDPRPTCLTAQVPTGMLLAR